MVTGLRVTYKQLNDEKKGEVWHYTQLKNETKQIQQPNFAGIISTGTR